MTRDDLASGEVHFRTAPTNDQPLSVVFGGDTRIGLVDIAIAILSHDDPLESRRNHGRACA